MPEVIGPDPRFYETLAPASLEELARITGGRLADPARGDRRAAYAASLVEAGAEGLAFCDGNARRAELAVTTAGAGIVAREFVALAPPTCAVIEHAHPAAAFALAAGRLHRLRRHEAGSPPVHPESRIEDGAEIAPAVAVGPGARIGRGTAVAPGTVIGPGVAIGRDCQIGAGARIACALIGDRVRIEAGAVIGAAGFGAAAGPKGVVAMPQLGRVVIQDGVGIGAGACIDRGAFGDTVIGENTQIDNLVQIGHNVAIGRDCVLAAHTGISGSVTIGDGCMFGGRAGVADHLTIGAGARIAAAAGLMHDVPAGESWGGVPARPVRRWLRETAMLARLAGRGAKGQGR